MTAIRFATLIDDHQELSDQRRRLMSSALMAAIVSIGVGTSMWVTEKLGINAVAPPKNVYQVTFQLNQVVPPTTPPPAPKVDPVKDTAAGGAAAQRKTVSVKPEPPEAEAPALEPVPARSRPKPVSGSPLPPGVKPGLGSIGIPGGPPGIGTCITPPCAENPPPRRPISPIRPEPKDLTRAPIKTVMAKARYSPDPDVHALARTTTGRTNRRPGRSTVSFCVDDTGHTVDVRTRRAFGGDPEVDRICRQTVSSWRFYPLKVGGRARKTCTSVTFELRFE
ncbi:MAG: hypothetical protein AAF799_19405 [Myxococcota bacterium]